MTVQEAISITKSIRMEYKKNNKQFGVEALTCAIESMEKQIPKKPKVKPLGEDIEVECPACGNIHIFLATKKGDKFCNDCGQAIDWEEGGTSV